MSSRLRQFPLAALALLVVLALGACGDSHTKVSTGTYAGESGSNAPYLDVGPLVYEVQLSRQLNPYSTADAPYLQGLTPAQRALAPGQEWFGIFIQVYNHGARPFAAAARPVIYDTQSNFYEPIQPGITNQFAYRGDIVPPDERLPPLGSVASNGSTQGLLLLYKIRTVSLDNRPLKISIVDPTNATERASAELDV